MVKTACCYTALELNWLSSVLVYILWGCGQVNWVNGSKQETRSQRQACARKTHLGCLTLTTRLQFKQWAYCRCWRCQQRAVSFENMQVRDDELLEFWSHGYRLAIWYPRRLWEQAWQSAILLQVTYYSWFALRKTSVFKYQSYLVCRYVQACLWLPCRGGLHSCSENRRR